MYRPFISVLVTSYNRQNYIIECLESIINSSYNNFEVLVVDDCSSDNTVAYAKSVASMDERIRIVVNEKNLGQFQNRNRAAVLAKYDYIKYLDSDDVMYSHCLEVYANAIRQFPQAAIYSECIFSAYKGMLPVIFHPESSYINNYLHGSQLLRIGPSGCLYNKKMFFESNCFDEKLGILADTSLMLKMAAVSAIVGVARDTIYWREHAGQVTEGQKDYIRMLIERYNIDKLILSANTCPLKGSTLVKVNNNVNARFGRNLLRVLYRYGNLQGFIYLRKKSGYKLTDIIKSLIPNKLLNSG